MTVNCERRTLAWPSLTPNRGQFDKANQAMDKEYAIAERKNDVASMAADLQAKGNILMAASRYDEAAKQFERSLQITEDSVLSQEIKDNANLQHHFNLAVLAIAKKDYASAKTRIRIPVTFIKELTQLALGFGTRCSAHLWPGVTAGR